MKMNKKRSPKKSPKVPNSADEAESLMGSGALKKAAKALRTNRKTKKARLGDIMSQIRSGR